MKEKPFLTVAAEICQIITLFFLLFPSLPTEVRNMNWDRLGLLLAFLVSTLYVVYIKHVERAAKHNKMESDLNTMVKKLERIEKSMVESHKQLTERINRLENR